MNKKEQIDIIMFNMSSFNDWQSGIQNRNFHVLKNLRVNEKIGRILAVDYLPHTFKRALKNYKDNIISRSTYPIILRTPFSRAISVDDKLVVYSTVLSKVSRDRFYLELEGLVKKLGLKNYLVWSFYPLKVSYFSKLSGRLNIFDAVDNWSEHPSYAKQKAQLKANYKIIDQQADIIFTVAEGLQDLFSSREKVHWIPNGVDLKHYQGDYPIINRDIGEITHPIIGYVGTIQDRLDQDLLEYLVKLNSDKSFVMVGPVWYKEILERFSNYANLHFLGRKSYEEVPMYIQQFDVGIIPHKVDKFSLSTNPMKVYEYLACGKPVISTKDPSLAMFERLVDSTNDYQEFNRLLQTALAKGETKLKEQRLEAVKDHSWLKRVETMLELIIKKL